MASLSYAPQSVRSNLAPADLPYLFDIPPKALLKDAIASLPLSDDVYDAVPIPGSEENGYSAVYRNKASVSALKEALSPGRETLHDIFEHSVAAHGDEPCLAWRPYDYEKGILANTYEYMLYREVDHERKGLALGLLYLLAGNRFRQPLVYELHRQIENHAANYKNYSKDNMSFMVAIHLENRKEWTITDLACSSIAVTNTLLYDTLGDSASEYILQATQAPVVVALLLHVEQLVALKLKQPEALGALILIISMDPLPKDTQLNSQAEFAGIILMEYSKVVAVGHTFPISSMPPTPEAIQTISFTLGTTGAHPKGVLLPHRVVGALAAMTIAQVPHKVGTKSFCFLPLAHVFERQAVANDLAVGACVGYPQKGGTPLTLSEDLRLFKPHQMCNVPRVISKWEAALKAVTVELTLATTKALFSRIVKTKMEAQSLADGATGAHSVYDKLFLPKVRQLLGLDNISFIVSGSAPIDASSLRFLKAVLGMGLIQGYGLTECFGGMCWSNPFELNPGSCGSTGVSVEVRLRELPEMGYTLTDKEGPRGELLMRGPQIFAGYFKNAEETAKALSKDGWFSTGDVARIDPKNGRIFIIDRVKNFFKLAHGEYVTPEKVENNYLANNSMLMQAFVHGDSIQNYLVAVLGISHSNLVSFLTGVCNVPRDAVTDVNRALEEINKRQNRRLLLQSLNKNVVGLQGFEKFHNIYVEIEPLTLERNVITPTVKLKRPIAAKFFGKQIESMYAEGSLLKEANL